MMVKGGIVVSDHSDQSFRSTSPTHSKTPSDNECEIPCEGDLLVVRRMKLKEKILFTRDALSTSYVP